MAHNLQMGLKTLLKTKLPNRWRKQTCNCVLVDLANIRAVPGYMCYKCDVLHAESVKELCPQLDSKVSGQIFYLSDRITRNAFMV